jgi:hypothetical protein
MHCFSSFCYLSQRVKAKSFDSKTSDSDGGWSDDEETTTAAVAAMRSAPPPPSSGRSASVVSTWLLPKCVGLLVLYCACGFLLQSYSYGYGVIWPYYVLFYSNM